jgi:hypothetical protein
MPSRRRQEREILDPAVEREMRELHVQLDVMDIAQRWTTKARDVSEAESENEAGAEKEVLAEDTAEEHLFRAIARIGARENMDISMYEGNLDIEELLD